MKVFLSNIIQLFTKSDNVLMDRDVHQWRQEICDTVFLFFCIFALFTYIPSMYLSIKERYYIIAIADTLFYISFLILVLLKRLNYKIKATIGLFFFYLLGVVLLVVLGPLGAGEIWIFTTTILAAFLLGNTGALVAFAIYTLTNICIWLLLNYGFLDWTSRFNIIPAAWLIKSANYILLNLSVVVTNALFIEGFKHLVIRIIQTRNASMIGLAKLAEYRDSETGHHLVRVQCYIELLADDLRKSPKYHSYITKAYIRDLKNSIILHDIGKVGIQDSILLKPGKLDKAEYEVIKKHPLFGGDVIAEIEKNISGRSLYSLGKEIALYHHERWDGTGYPEGLKGEAIPLSARLTALVDVYDALVTLRPYKAPIPHTEAIAIIKKQNGGHFDPDVVNSFLNMEKEFKKVHDAFPDDLA